MINPNELRIGNWVIHNNPLTDKSVYHQVTAGTFSKLTFHAREYEPIPLTPELLEKCGFVKIESGSTPYGDHDAYIIGEESGRLIWSAGRLLKPIPNGYLRIAQAEIKYLHQLQNIIFDMTGEELEIKI